MTLPRAGGWMIMWALICLAIILPIFPFILYFRKRRAKREMKVKVDEARTKILEDGIVEGPKGPYVRHKKWNVGSELGTPRDGPPRQKAYKGTEWQ